MRFMLEIDCDNAAFGSTDLTADGISERNAEVARILREAADRIEGGALAVKLRDVNGNTVGQAGFQMGLGL